MRASALCCLLATLAASPAAWAQPRCTAIYLNGVKLEGGELRSQALTAVDVKFDAHGDLHITAHGYKVTAEPPADGKSHAATTTPAPFKRRYYIAGQQPHIGAAQWDMEISVDNQHIKRFRSRDPEPVFEITRFLKPGINVLHIRATKEPGARISTSPEDYFELVIGDGEMRAGQLVLHRIAGYRRTAAEVGSYQADITLEVTR